VTGDTCAYGAGRAHAGAARALGGGGDARLRVGSLLRALRVERAAPLAAAPLLGVTALTVAALAGFLATR